MSKEERKRSEYLTGGGGRGKGEGMVSPFFLNKTVFSGGFRISQRGCANSKGGGGRRQPTICLIFPENCMKMKEF